MGEAPEEKQQANRPPQIVHLLPLHLMVCAAPLHLMVCAAHLQALEQSALSDQVREV
jgi:hypothetical protein